MKPKKLKCYVLTVSEYFPSYHPRKKEETYFPLKVMEGEKIHTIRANYEFWKKRIDAINRGEAYLSLRKWSDKPYRSPQVEIKRLYKVGIQKLKFDGSFLLCEHGYDVFPRIDKSHSCIHVLAKNDGLSDNDFSEWFPNLRVIDLSEKVIPMAIIHFTDFRY